MSILAFLVVLFFAKNIKKTFYIYLLAFFLLLVGLSCMFAYDKASAWLGLARLVGFAAENDSKPILFISNIYYYTGFITYLICGILFLLGTLVSKPVKLLKLLLISSSIISIIVLLQFAGIDLVPWNDIAIPVSGTMGNPNYLASFMVFVLPGGFLLYVLNDDYLALSCSALSFASLIISNTRGAWITCVFILIIIFTFILTRDIKQKARKLIIISCVIATILVTLLPMKDGLFLKRGISIKNEITTSIQLEDEGGAGRLYIWKEVIKIINDHWLFGIGPDNLVFEKIVYNDAVNAKAHNNLLEIAVTMGIPALIAYVAFMLSVFLQYRKGNTLQFTVLLMCLSYLIQGLTNIDMIMIYPLFWIVLGMSIAFKRLQIA
jgi:O-antigen ligase